MISRQLLIAVLVLASCTANAVDHYRYHEPFSNHEKARMEDWVEQSDTGLRALFGELPFSYTIHLYRLENAHSPVPWAHTRKGRNRSVHFYVDTSHSQAQFLKDWTAPHEISHLLFPYLGDSGRWFAEGFATYLQYQVLYANGLMSWDEVIAKLDSRFAVGRHNSVGKGLSIVAHGQRLRELRGMPRLYWGGAAYFLAVDHTLGTQHQLRLNDVVNSYLEKCPHCREKDERAMMATLDRLSGTEVFTKIYRETVVKPGFPETEAALKWLSQHPPSLHPLSR